MIFRSKLATTFAMVALVTGCTMTDETDGPTTKAEAAEGTIDGKTDWTLDWCEINDWYDDGDCDWFCPRRDHDCDVPLLGPDPSGSKTRLPIVLAHGFDASPTNRWGWYGVAEALRADGHEVYVAVVEPYRSPEDRAETLAEHVDLALRSFDAPMVNILAHSMGGLDSRVLVSPDGLGYGDRVASVTTISSPHKGTPIGDLALAITPGFADDAINSLAESWGLTFNALATDSDVRAALEGLSEANSSRFAASYPDDSRVYYQSWAGVSSVLGLANAKVGVVCEGKLLMHPGTSDRVNFTLAPMALVVGGLSREPNDGMATVVSAKYGDFQGCIPADHLDEVGQVRHDGPNLDTGFDHVRFYRNLAYDLERAGF